MLPSGRQATHFVIMLSSTSTCGAPFLGARLVLYVAVGSLLLFWRLWLLIWKCCLLSPGDFTPDVSFSSRNGCMVFHLEGYWVDKVSATKPAFDMDQVLQRGGFFWAQLALQ
ncbi:hypothetical protein P171DRAFT_518786 [Karstenula rhodostoma CBS 690.94]|uniref:Uncharacterized protein n=1 Tax=Karstenula rhodostoma CBS 690.94 TaxID=1392251 RepID=A0A9P4PM98_9PLEO|nr:hypothetical protein P171DRAFT_518786 [Karstenula rhodostoma CBS 690.94]